MRKSIYWIALFAAIETTEALATPNYEFCVSRTSNANRDVLHVSYNFAGIDLGKEAARVAVSSMYTKADTTSIQVADYSVGVCGNLPSMDETTTKVSMEDAKGLFAQLGSANPIVVANALRTLYSVTTIVTKSVIVDTPTKVEHGANKVCTKIKRLFSHHPC